METFSRFLVISKMQIIASSATSANLVGHTMQDTIKYGSRGMRRNTSPIEFKISEISKRIKFVFRNKSDLFWLNFPMVVFQLLPTAND